MESTPLPRVIEAQRLSGGVIITFDDGKCAVFSAALLHATFSQAKEIKESELDAD
jgi:hypothetical protein